MRWYWKLRSRLLFLWKSTNRHGVHSPFVYEFITKCLYQKLKKENLHAIKKHCKKNNCANLKKITLLYQIVHHFEVRNILDLNSSDHLLTLSLKEVTISKKNKNLKNSLFDLIIVDYQTFPEKLEELYHYMHNDTIILFDAPYTSPNTYNKWKQIVKKSTITVSVDLFYLGLLFIRTEQVKEHFIIRA
ncbi:hypothetical protein [Leptobacterium sp. I13]|uniref:hypothetical protein n=1 Tax=Leptobacterium meishanense TaxID=3128904 RepID=UPI0030EB14EF